MEFVAAGIFLFENNYIANQVEQSFFEPQVLLAGLKSGKEMFDLPLRIELVFQEIISARTRNKKFAFYYSGIRSKNILQNFIVNKRFRITVMVKGILRSRNSSALPGGPAQNVP